MAPTIEQEPPSHATPTQSLHSLSVENGRFAVHPLEWTSKHLQLLDINFVEFDGEIDPSRLHVDREERRAETAERMSYGTRYFYNISIVLIREGSPLKACVGNGHEFYYNGQLVCKLNYRAYRIADDVATKNPQPIVGFHQYSARLERAKRFRPKTSSSGNNLNMPGRTIRAIKLRKTTPELWQNDPYLVCHLLSLASLQYSDWVKSGENAQGPRLFLARLLVVHELDLTHAFVFKANVPSQILECLGQPTRSMGDAKFPHIYFTKVAFRPFKTFSERVLLTLLGSESLSISN
ncbi:hypothetical protein ACHAPU_002985 [Fusarium lateritium]